jgi:hypothetical protein
MAAFYRHPFLKAIFNVLCAEGKAISKAWPDEILK